MGYISSLVGGSDHDIPFSFGVCAFQSNIDSRYFYEATTAISTHLRNTALTGLLCTTLLLCCGGILATLLNHAISFQEFDSFLGLLNFFLFTVYLRFSEIYSNVSLMNKLKAWKCLVKS